MTYAWVERNTNLKEGEVIAGIKTCIIKGIQPIVTTNRNPGLYTTYPYNIFRLIGGVKSRAYMEEIDDIKAWAEVIYDLDRIARRTGNRTVFVDNETLLEHYWSGMYTPDKYALRTISGMLTNSKLRVVMYGIALIAVGGTLPNPGNWPSIRGWSICVAFRKQAYAVGYYGWVNQKQRAAKYIHGLLSSGYDMYYCRPEQETRDNDKIYWAAGDAVKQRGPVLLYPGLDNWKETMESL